MRTVLANPELGAKQVCPNCQTKFYDLNRRPAHCPKCGFEFDPEEALRNRRVRTRGATPNYEDDQPADKPARDEEAEGEEEEENEALPEIDEAAEETDTAGTEDEDAAGGAPEPDAGVGEDFGDEEEAADEGEADDVPFLEEEEEFDDGDDLEVGGGGDEEER